MVLGEAGQGLGGVHANIVFGEDDLAVQARAQRRSPRRGVKGQEVGGLGGGAPQEPTERHLLRRGDAGSILWGAEDAVMVNDGPTSGNVLGAREERNSNAWTLRPCTVESTASAPPSGVTHRPTFTAVSFLPAVSPLPQSRLSPAVCSRRGKRARRDNTRATFPDDCTRTEPVCANTLGRRPCETPSSYQRPADVGASERSLVPWGLRGGRRDRLERRNFKSARSHSEIWSIA